MKKLTSVIAITLLVVSVLGTGVLTWRDFRDAGQLSELESKMEKVTGDAAAGKQLMQRALKQTVGTGVSSSQFRLGGIAAGLVFLFSLVVLIFLFKKNPRIPYIGGLALLGLSILMILANPAYNTGVTGPASARTLALILGVITILGALGSVARVKLWNKEAPAAG